MEHNHVHSYSHTYQLSSLSRILILCITLNLLFTFIEAFIGVRYNSVALLSDAGHNLSDVFSLLLAMLAFKLSRVKGNDRYTYGYKKGTILASLINAIVLLAVAGIIIVKSISKLENPSPVDGEAMSWTALVGIFINGITVLLLRSKQKADINIKGAFLHALSDTLVSVGVVVSGVIITKTGYTPIDAIIGIVIAFVIIVSTVRLLMESTRMAMNGVPLHVSIKQIKELITNTKGVIGYEDLHIWAISSTENALTVHIEIYDINQIDKIKHQLRESFKVENLHHITLEVSVKNQ